MRIEKNGMVADAPEGIADDLIREMGWSAASRSVTSTGARFVSPEELDTMVDKMVAMSVTGGKDVPPNKDWTVCPLAGSGTGLVEFRCINGTVQFRGTLKVSVSNAGSHTIVRALPAGTERYRPAIAVNLPAYAVDTGTSYRIAMVRVNDADGKISVAAPTGKFDTVEFDGLSYQVF